MIVGFDHDTPATFTAHREFVAQARVMHAMISMLSAIPKTRSTGGWPRKAGSTWMIRSSARTSSRWDEPGGDARRLRAVDAGFYEPDAYFQRFEALYLSGNFRFGCARARYWRRHPWRG